jgi:hypothetical protein
MTPPRPSPISAGLLALSIGFHMAGIAKQLDIFGLLVA